MHACELAEALGIPRVILPALPGALSAFGILVSDIVKNYSRTVLWSVKDKLPVERLGQEFARLRKNAEKDFAAEEWHSEIQCLPSADVRFRGQGYELNVPYTRGMIDAFHREHRRRYGYSYANREIELVTLRLRASVKSAQSKVAGARPGTGADRPPQQTVHSASRAGQIPLILDGRRTRAAIYDRERLVANKRLLGPAIVAEYSATTLVPPGKRFCADKAGNLVIEI